MKQWEYKSLKLEEWALDDPEKIDLNLNNYGSQGWELVSVDDNRHYFKRPLKSHGHNN